jgi:hypothetical protein
MVNIWGIDTGLACGGGQCDHFTAVALDFMDENQ